MTAEEFMSALSQVQDPTLRAVLIHLWQNQSTNRLIATVGRWLGPIIVGVAGVAISRLTG